MKIKKYKKYVIKKIGVIKDGIEYYSLYHGSQYCVSVKDMRSIQKVIHALEYNDGLMI